MSDGEKSKKSLLDKLKPGSELRDKRDVVLHFSPSWFGLAMGTGILAFDMGFTPLRFPGQQDLGWALWWVTVVMFVAASVMFVARWVLYPKDARDIFEHPVHSMFLGCIPIALGTIVDGTVLFIEPRLGYAGVIIAIVLWWIDFVMAVAVVLSIPLCMIYLQSHSVETVTCIWLLGVVPGVAVAASGSFLAPVIAHTGHAQVVEYLSLALIGAALPLCLTILALFFNRIVFHHLPAKEVIVSCFLPLSPLGAGALAISQLGAAAKNVFPSGLMHEYVRTAGGLGIFLGYFLWGFGFWWFAFACFVVARAMYEGLPFNLGWWSFAFPFGAFTAALLNLGILSGWVPAQALGTGFT